VVAGRFPATSWPFSGSFLGTTWRLSYTDCQLAGSEPGSGWAAIWQRIGAGPARTLSGFRVAPQFVPHFNDGLVQFEINSRNVTNPIERPDTPANIGMYLPRMTIIS
jgi:hypothetical protein